MGSVEVSAFAFYDEEFPQLGSAVCSVAHIMERK